MKLQTYTLSLPFSPLSSIPCSLYRLENREDTTGCKFREQSVTELVLEKGMICPYRLYTSSLNFSELLVSVELRNPLWQTNGSFYKRCCTA